MRAQLLWPRTLSEWLPGLIVSVPLTLLLLGTRSNELGIGAVVASAVVALSVPWVVPATMLLAVASSPIYMWLHTQGPAPSVPDWLGGVVLVAAVIGCHLNAALFVAWRRARKSEMAESGLRDFLFPHGQRK